MLGLSSPPIVPPCASLGLFSLLSSGFPHRQLRCGYFRLCLRLTSLLPDRWLTGRKCQANRGKKKGCCAVRTLHFALAVTRYDTLYTLQRQIIGKRCPHIARLSFGGSRRSDIMGIGYQDTSDIPAREKMQGMNGSAVVGSGGQHTEPVKIVNELADCLTVASQIFR